MTLEFSRRARGIPIWAALRTLGRDGVAELVDRHCELAKRIGEKLAEAGYQILNDVPINQVLVRAATDTETRKVMGAVQESGVAWVWWN